MKELGEKLRVTREKSGVNLGEAATDLDVKEEELVALEEGNVDSFQDVYYLKHFIKEYAKYLGIDSEKIVDSFNEYLFDYTSKIPIDKIKEASEKLKTVKKDIVSPYTKKIETKKNKNIIIYVLFGIAAVALLFMIFKIIF